MIKLINWNIFRNVVRLEEYLVRYQALQVIIDSLKEEETSDQNLLQDQVACLHSLANDVYLENPRIPCTLCKKCDVGSLTKEATISFLLDDGSTVTANKHTICEKSEFFEAMFRYGFKEANESVVRLSNISSDCLRVLFRLLYSYCDCIVPRNIIILLELIVQSDRFLVPSLSERLLDITLNYMLDYKNCHLIYDWAIENGRFLPSSQEVPICQNVLKFVLVEKLTFNERLYSLRMLLKSRYKANVLSDIAQIIECQLRCKDIQMKSSVKYIKETAAKRYKISWKNTRIVILATYLVIVIFCLSVLLFYVKIFNYQFDILNFIIFSNSPLNIKLSIIDIPRKLFMEISLRKTSHWFF